MVVMVTDTAGRFTQTTVRQIPRLSADGETSSASDGYVTFGTNASLDSWLVPGSIRLGCILLTQSKQVALVQMSCSW